MPNNNRRPAGTPAGGQFAPRTHAESGVKLDAADMVPKPSPVASPDLADLNDRLTQLRDSYYTSISDDHLDDLTYEVAAAFERAQARTFAERSAFATSKRLGVPFRSTEEVLYEPLSPFEIAMRRDENNFVEGYIAVDLGDVIDGDLESHLDQIGEKLVGSSSLMDVNFEPVRIENGAIVGKASGDVSTIVEYWEADNHEDVDDIDELDEDAKMFAIGVGARQALDPLRRRQD